MSLQEIQMLKEATGVDVPPRGEFAEWPLLDKEAVGGSPATIASHGGRVVRQMAVPTPRKLTPVEIAWGKARGYKWAIDAEAAQQETDTQASVSHCGEASLSGGSDGYHGYGDCSGDASQYGGSDGYYGYGYGDWSDDASQCGGSNGYGYGHGDWSGYASQCGGSGGYGYGHGNWSGGYASQCGGSDGYNGYGDWSGGYASQCGGYNGYGDWSGDASQCGGEKGYYGDWDASQCGGEKGYYGDWDASQCGGENGYYGGWDASQCGGEDGYYGGWDASQCGGENGYYGGEVKAEEKVEVEETKEDVEADENSNVDPKAEQIEVEEEKERTEAESSKAEEMTAQDEKVKEEKETTEAEIETKETVAEEEVKEEKETTEAEIETKETVAEEEVKEEKETTEAEMETKETEEEEDEVKEEKERTEAEIETKETEEEEEEVNEEEVKEEGIVHEDIFADCDSPEEALPKKFFTGVDDFEGVILPERLHDLAMLLKDRNYVTRDDVWYFYYNEIKDEEYLELLVEDALEHPHREAFEASVRESHQLLAWSFGCDGNETYIEDLAEMTHYLQTKEERKEELTKKVSKFELAKFDRVAKGLDFGFREPEDANKKNEDQRKREKERKRKKAAEVEKGEEIENPKAETFTPEAQQRVKGPGKRKAEKIDEAWVVKWAPVTKTGILDFVQNCLGQPVSSAEKPPATANTSVENFGYMNDSSISWQPIKPGETTYLLKHFFCRQVEE